MPGDSTKMRGVVELDSLNTADRLAVWKGRERRSDHLGLLRGRAQGKGRDSRGSWSSFRRAFEVLAHLCSKSSLPDRGGR